MKNIMVLAINIQINLITFSEFKITDIKIKHIDFIKITYLYLFFL